MFVESVLSDLHRDLWAQKRASKPKCISNVLCKLFVARNAHKSTWTAFVDASPEPDSAEYGTPHHVTTALITIEVHRQWLGSSQ